MFLFICPSRCFTMLMLLTVCETFAQDCRSTIMIFLENSRGGVYAGQSVRLTSRVDGRTYEAVSDARGEATFTVGCKEMFELSIANYTKKVDLESPLNGKQRQTFSYAPDMLQKQKMFAMTDAEKSAVDLAFGDLPDTTFMRSSVMAMPAKHPDYYALFILSVRDLKGGPLANETLSITGRKRNKTIKAVTDKSGRVLTYLPKGDHYDIHFKHHRGYYSAESDYSKGTTDIKVTFSYIGTRELERRRKEEADRVAMEERKIAEARDKFERDCRALGMTIEECHRREREKYLKGVVDMTDTVVCSVLNRNQWENKLVVCDVTGSMEPYVAQVALWYRLRLLKEKGLQFVFFNDGDNKPDDLKVIGDTGGVHYCRSGNIDSLDVFMSQVQALGYGGDCPENNMEALIKSIRMAAPFRELVMIADNGAPVKDLILLSSFNTPVHIIVCGARDNPVHPDYLKIAWKTKGSLHTMEEDITSLARLSEGQEITIGGLVYKIMGGEFVRL